MPQTLTAVHAPIGGSAAGLPEVAAAVTEAARTALTDSAALTDSWADARDGMLSLVVLHGAGEGDPEVHRAAWDALDAGMQAATAIGAPGLGEGLPVDAFPGSLRGTGVSSAEIVLTERPTGPLVVLLASEAPLGLFNLALARAFADPFTMPRLLASPSMRRGFHFEVHDLDEPRKRMFPAPAELHDLLACLVEADRYLLYRIVTAEGVVATATSSARRSDVLGPSAEHDFPVGIVRTGGDAPTLEELLGVFAAPQAALPAGASLGVVPSRALAFHVAGDRLLTPVDLFDGSVPGLVGAGPVRPRTAHDAEPSGGDPARWSER